MNMILKTMFGSVQDGYRGETFNKVNNRPDVVQILISYETRT